MEPTHPVDEIWRVGACGRWNFAIEARIEVRGKVLACVGREGTDDPRIAVEEAQGVLRDGRIGNER